MSTNWKQKLKCLLNKLNGKEKSFAEANIEAVKKSCKGIGPDADKPDKYSGARMVVNIASVHVPDFVKHVYKNGYDLGKYRIGKQRQKNEPKIRELVDDALPVSEPHKMYFGAVSLSGAGIRFYGDICLVLKGERIPKCTVILDRNSYDLVRQPFSDDLEGYPAKLKEKAKEISARWDQLGYVAAIKVVFPYSGKPRRMTSGQIAAGLLDDEDYIEVLKEGSFYHSDIESARISNAEAAAVSHIEDKQTLGPPATAAELLLANQRRQAIRELENSGIDVVVSTTPGRTK